MRASQRRGDFADVEEHKSGLGGVGLDGLGGELGGFDLVHFFFAEGPFDFFAWDGKRQGIRFGINVGLGIGEAACNVFGGDGRELGAANGEGDLHVGDRNGLGAVIGDDEEDGKESVLVKVDREKFGFLGIVVGVGGDGDSLVSVIVVRGIRFSGLGHRFDEVFGS